MSDEKRRAYQKAYYQKNREKLLAKQRERGRRNYRENPEQYRKRSKAWREANLERHKELQKDYQDRNADKIKAYRAAWYKANKRKVTAQSRRAKLARYGLTEAQFAEMLAAQNGRCAICLTDTPGARNFHVDHCHSTGKVRGILCSNCNTALGLMADDPETLRRALDYLTS